MSKAGSVRVEGAVLVGRLGGEYWFIDSVFRHSADFYGCTGTTVCPISQEQADEALSIENLEERFEDCWRESAAGAIQEDCEYCAGEPQEGGCEDCGYQSLLVFCEQIAQHDGYDAVFDDPGSGYHEALSKLPELAGQVELADCSGCGRMWTRVSYADFDEVYNPAALKACLAYEKGAISYDDAVRVIFGSSEG